MTARSRTKLEAADAENPASLRRVLNEWIAEMSTRMEAVESRPHTRSVEVRFDTGAVVGVGLAPFDGGLRIAATGEVLGVSVLRLDRVRPQGQPVSTSNTEVRWSYLVGGQGGDSGLVITFVTGLAPDSSYVLRLGVMYA